MSGDEAVREEFEAWAVSRHGLFAAMAPGGIATRIGDGYNKERVQILWESWQASRSAAIQECADIADKWAKSQSCDSHDNDPCCHVRTGAGIRDALLALKER